MIKIIILDQDNTLYRNSNLRDQYRSNLKNFFINELYIAPSKVDDWIRGMLKKYAYNWHELVDSLSIDHHKYAREVIDKLSVEKYLSIDKILIECLQNINLPKYVVTGSTPSFSKRIQKTLGLECIIKQTFIVNFSSDKYDLISKQKIDYYDLILKKENVQPREVCVFGDSFTFDLEDAAIHGYHTVLVGRNMEYPYKIKTIYEINDVIREIDSLYS